MLPGFEFVFDFKLVHVFATPFRQVLHVSELGLLQRVAVIFVGLRARSGCLLNLEVISVSVVDRVRFLLGLNPIVLFVLSVDLVFDLQYLGQFELLPRSNVH